MLGMQEMLRSFWRRGKMNLEKQGKHPGQVPGEMLVARGVFPRNPVLSPANLYYHFSPYSPIALTPAMLVLTLM